LRRKFFVPTFSPDQVFNEKHNSSLNSRRTADGGEGVFSSSASRSHGDSGVMKMSKLRSMPAGNAIHSNNGRVVAKPQGVSFSFAEASSLYKKLMR
jgi:hypothetical protein